ncbi:MAG: MarR family transcriptional regulator [bacterium]|nr:MarR family transcriptional regulator [bacterium]
MEQLNDIVFYTIDRAIRTYRQYAQRELKRAGFTITIDQWLIIKNIVEYPEISQQELSEKVFKDNASVTRIIELLVKAGYLERNISNSDRRRTKLKVTSKGKKIIAHVHKVVLKNRTTALSGLSEKEIESMKGSLLEIIKNCSK